MAAAVGENRKMVIFPLDQVPEMARGRGVRLQRHKDGGLSDVTTFKGSDGLAQNDMRRSLPRFQGESLEHNLRLVTHLEAMASRRGCAPTQLALAWLLAKGQDIVPIPGTKRRAYLESNAAAAAMDLTPAEMAELEEAFPLDAASGERYNPEFMRWVDR